MFSYFLNFDICMIKHDKKKKAAVFDFCLYCIFCLESFSLTWIKDTEKSLDFFSTAPLSPTTKTGTHLVRKGRQSYSNAKCRLT